MQNQQNLRTKVGNSYCCMAKNLPNQNSFLNDNFSITSKKCIEIAYCQHKEKKWQTAAFFVNIKKRSEEIIELQF